MPHVPHSPWKGLKVMPRNIELIDGDGNKFTVTEAHWNRYPQLAETFRPVAEKKTTAPVVTEAPTGDNTKEN